MREILREAKSKPCADCGRFFPYFVMDLDHREGVEKISAVALMVSALSIQQMLNEIEKCDVVCANCHRIRTFNRDQWRVV